MKIVYYATSAMKRSLMSVSLQHEPKASDVITLVKKTFFRTSIVRNFISRGVKMRISAREACVKPLLRTRSDIKKFISLRIFENKYEGWLTPVKTNSSLELINSSTGVCISV